MSGGTAPRLPPAFGDDTDWVGKTVGGTTVYLRVTDFPGQDGPTAFNAWAARDYYLQAGYDAAARWQPMTRQAGAVASTPAARP